MTEDVIVECVKQFLVNKPRGNWHVEKTKIAGSHGHDADLICIGGKRNSEYFIIECKGKSYAKKSAKSINRECWVHALGQLITRMNTKRIIQSGKTKGQPNRAYKYGLGLYWVGAKTALRRIPKEAANALQLNVFSVYEDGFVKQWTPSQFGVSYEEVDFKDGRINANANNWLP